MAPGSLAAAGRWRLLRRRGPWRRRIVGGFYGAWVLGGGGMAIVSGFGGVGAAKAEPVRRLSWLAAADLGALRRRRAPGGLVGPKVGTPVVPRMGPTRRLQPPGVALSEAQGPRRRNLLGLQFAGSKRTPVTRGCSAPPSHRSSRRNPKRLRPARRPPAAKRSQSRRRQPAQTPTALRLRRHDAPRPRSDLKSAAANQPSRRQSAPPSVQNARRPRSDPHSTAANPLVAGQAANRPYAAAATRDTGRAWTGPRGSVSALAGAGRAGRSSSSGCPSSRPARAA